MPSCARSDLPRIRERSRFGSITKTALLSRKNNILANLGLINGSEIGGAAAFVALFYNYSFKSVFRDYFAMDDAAFKEKYDAYLNSLGF